MAEVKWIKLNIDMFDNRKIKHIRRLPEGDNIVLIWVMLLTMAGRCNASGMIFLTENIPYTTKMLADELGFSETVIVAALNTLERFGMVSCKEEAILIPGWKEYQNIEGMERIKEQTRERVKRYRDKKKCDGNATVTLRNGDVTQQNKKEDIEKDINNLCADKSAQDSFDVDQQMADFEKIYAIYPKKRGKTKAFEYYRGFVGKTGRLINGKRYKLDRRQLYIAVANYISEQEQQGIAVEFYKNCDTFFNKTVLDYLEGEA